MCVCMYVHVRVCVCQHVYVLSHNVLQMYSIRSLPTIGYREQKEEDGVEDMTQLE